MPQKSTTGPVLLNSPSIYLCTGCSLNERAYPADPLSHCSEMGSLRRALFGCLVLAAMTMELTVAEVVVSGVVFCDRCKDGRMSFFDYPHSGVKVALACADEEGQVRVLKERSTNRLGHYLIRLPGNPDMRGCWAQVVEMPHRSRCGGSAGPATGLNLHFRMFNLDMYTAGPLLTRPTKAMAFCGAVAAEGSSPTASPAPPATALPPTALTQQSACTYENWTMPENKCNWKVVRPDTKVAIAFGLPAAFKYGTDLTLWEALHGRGDVYKTLLREGTAALLNSFSNTQFEYPTLTVLGRMTWALEGPEKEALMQAFRFRRANSGTGNVTNCHLLPCSS
ncbi:unnamed protein product [Victoria cruziana]